MSNIGKSIKDRKKTSACLGLGGLGTSKRGVTLKLSLWGDESVPELIMVVVTQLDEYTKSHEFLTFYMDESYAI